MSVILGTGEHRYRVIDDWAKLPDTWTFLDVAAVAVDNKDISVPMICFTAQMMVTTR
jgi:hypothetical protein